jgi:hypothetical protein
MGVFWKVDGKNLLFKVHIIIDGLDKHQRAAYVLGKLLSIIATIPVFVAFYWITASIMQAFIPFEPPSGHY